jgi:hypothetical protein
MVVAALVIAVLSASAPTNMEILEAVVDEACLPLADSLAAAGLDTVMLEITGEHPGGWLVGQSVKAVLDSRGVTVLTEVPRDSVPPVRLSIRPMELSVMLDDAGRTWLIGARRIDRTVMCELYSEVLDPSGVLLLSARSGASRSDRIGESELPGLRSSSDQAWITGGEPAEGGGGLLEPLVVTGVVASLIYLFYSSRAE